MSKINVLPIMRGHLETLRDYSTGKLSVWDVVVFFLVPFVLGALGVRFGWGFSVEALNALLAAFAIFAGLLLNLLLLVYTFASEGFDHGLLARVKARFIREVHSNIAYSVLVSVCIVVVALVAVVRLKSGSSPPERTGPYMTFVLVYLAVHFGATLLMILKRIHAMISEKLNSTPMKKAS